MTRIIRNPIYCGLIVNKMLEGEVAEGQHQPLISKKLFLEVNGILSTRIASGWRKDEENALLPLKRFMRILWLVIAERDLLEAQGMVEWWECTRMGRIHDRALLLE